MLKEINLKNLKTKFNLDIRGIINVGSYIASEYIMFKELEIKNSIFIEANPHIIPLLKNNVGSECLVFNNLLLDQDDVEVKFKIANHLQASSVLDFCEHKNHYPELSIINDIIKLKSKKLDSVIRDNNINMDNYNMLMIDVQGVEKLVLDGFSQNISKIDYIYSEINFVEMYDTCMLFDKYTLYLNKLGFELTEYFDTGKGWGDGLYIRNN
jgi:FkbM family methyltransferase